MLAPALSPFVEVAVGTVHRLHPIRVLLASRDPRYLGVIRFLLGRNGFGIETTRRLSRLPEMIDRHGADVVVVDGTDSPAAAARAAETVNSYDPQVGVVLVAEHFAPGARRSSDPLHKWSPFEDIVAEIERAYAEAARAPRATDGIAMRERRYAPVVHGHAAAHKFSDTPLHASLLLRAPTPGVERPGLYRLNRRG